MSQQTLIITFNRAVYGEDGHEYQINTLEEILLNASPDIEIARKPRNEYAQGGIPDLIVTAVTSGAAIAAIKVIATWIRRTHSASIDIEIKGSKIKAQNITSKNYEFTIREMLKQVQDNNGGKEL